MPRVNTANYAAPRAHLVRPHIPRRVVTLRRLLRYGLLSLVLFTGLGCFLTGHLDSFDNRIAGNIYAWAATLGFQVNDVNVEGRQFTSAGDILTALGLHKGDPILGFDPDNARTTLELLPRIASADVERHLPDTISIRLVERVPMAIWQKNGKMVLIDHDGIVLGDRLLAEYTTLPMVVGEDAAKPASSILEAVATEPVLAKRVTAYVRVGGRRWNLRLDNNVEIKLPETDADVAVHRIAGIEAKNGLFEHDVVAVDLRLPGKMIVETSQLRDPKRKPQPQQGI